MPTTELDDLLTRAAGAVRSAEALLIGAGAGMGVDSGLPDFRGDEGFWKAYPPFRGRKFMEVSNPAWFQRDPAQAWGFFGHRHRLYSRTPPHAGFGILRRWAECLPGGCFVFTSNVDGHFQRAGFPEDRVVECHGSIHYLQCVGLCCRDIWPADGLDLAVDEATIRAAPPFPACPHCKGLARPNILMFGDWHWLHTRTSGQKTRFGQWLESVRGRRLVALEFGAGLAIPTVRNHCEAYASVLIRVNPREPQVARGHLGIPLGALEALRRMDELM